MKRSTERILTTHCRSWHVRTTCSNSCKPKKLASPMTTRALEGEYVARGWLHSNSEGVGEDHGRGF